MKIKDNVHKNKFKAVVYDAEALYFFVKNAPLTDEFQKIAKNLLDFVYSLDINKEVEHGQFVYPHAMHSESAMRIFNKIMSKKTGVKFRKKEG